MAFVLVAEAIVACSKCRRRSSESRSSASYAADGRRMSRQPFPDCRGSADGGTCAGEGLGQERATAESGEDGYGPLARMSTEAGDGARTHDPQLGKLMLYQLSYAREAFILAALRAWAVERARSPAEVPMPLAAF
jgi:hypothetical protein